MPSGVYCIMYITTIMFQAQLFLNKTVGELLFDGYEDDLVTIFDAFSDENEKQGIPMDKFGWFYKVTVWFYKVIGCPYSR